MKKLILIVALALVSTSVWGLMPTRWQYFEKLDDQTLPTPTEDTAVIVFMLVTDGEDVGNGFLLTGFHKKLGLVYDVTSETPKLLGMVRRGYKTAYEVPPGEYLFLSSNLLAVNVVAGKTYYIHANDAMGVSMFTRLAPVRNGGEGKYQYSSEWIQNGLDKTELVKTHPKSQKYYGKEKWIKIAKKSRNEYMEEWKTKTESERQKFTLNPEDGIPAGYYSNQNTQSSQVVRTEPNTAQPSFDEQKEARTSAVENPESIKPVSPTYTSELEALKTIRDDGIISEEEFQDQKLKLLEKE